ncbi:MAG: TolC family protein [Sulfurimonas sp.]|nr:TolC family protein [Sulfurimonas sp.]
MRHFALISLTALSLQAMSLNETISYTLEHNNALQQANISVERSKTLRDSKQGQRFGRVDVLASYDHYNNPRTLEPLTPISIAGSPDGAYTIPTTKDLFNVGIAYNVILFDGFAQQSSYEMSDLQYENSSIRSKLGREELIYNVRNLYVSILALQEQLSAQDLYTTSQVRLLERILQEKELGSKSKLDVLKAKSSAQSSRSQVASLEANISTLKATLSALMGDKEFDKTSPLSIVIDKSNKNALGESEISSLDRYKAANLNIQVSQKKIDQVSAANYPKIDFGAYYGGNFGPNDTTNTVPSTGQTLISEGDWNSAVNWQVGVHLKWNVLDFGSTSAMSEEAKLALFQAKLEGNSVKIEMRKNILTAQNNIKLAIAQYNNYFAQYELLNETQKIETVRYENNALTLTDLLNTGAKKELTHAQMINAKYNYQKASYYLDYLLEKGETK